MTYKGINAYRFVTSDDFLSKIGPQFGNECFCTTTIEKVPAHPSGCLYGGALDLTSCLGIQNFIYFVIFSFKTRMRAR